MLNQIQNTTFFLIFRNTKSKRKEKEILDLGTLFVVGQQEIL